MHTQHFAIWDQWQLSIHDDVIKWKYFPRYWLFEREIHRSPVNSPHKGQWHGALMVFFICAIWDQWQLSIGAGRRLVPSGRQAIDCTDYETTDALMRLEMTMFWRWKIRVFIILISYIRRTIVLACCILRTNHVIQYFKYLFRDATLPLVVFEHRNCRYF